MMSIDIRRRQRCDTRVAIKTKPTPHQLPRRGGSASLMWVQYKSTFYYCFNYNFSPVSDSLSLWLSPRRLVSRLAFSISTDIHSKQFSFLCQGHCFVSCKFSFCGVRTKVITEVLRGRKLLLFLHGIIFLCSVKGGEGWRRLPQVAIN